MTYWVYEDLPTNHAKVHEASCGFCRDGLGTKRVKVHPNETKWHGPYGSIELAKAAADGTGRRDVGYCRGCLRPPASHRVGENPKKSAASSGYKRFEVPDVDESKLSLDEVFHRRMQMIYVSMRDQLGYSARRFLTSVNRHGGVEHAKRALRRPVQMQTGLARLRDEGKLGESMEAHVCDPQFASLFTPSEIAEARQRLDAMKESG